MLNVTAEVYIFLSYIFALPDVQHNQFDFFLKQRKKNKPWSLAARLMLACHYISVIGLAAFIHWVVLRRFPTDSWLSYWPDLPLDWAHKAGYYSMWQIWHISVQSCAEQLCFPWPSLFTLPGTSSDTEKGETPWHRAEGWDLGRKTNCGFLIDIPGTGSQRHPHANNINT